MIYFFDSYEKYDPEDFLKLLPENRLKKYRGLKRKRDRENCVYAHMLLLRALREEFGITEPKFDFIENGKPVLTGGEAHFNISHCGKGIAVAAAKSPVGVDIQEARRFGDGVMKRVFSAEETAIVNASADREKAFARIWSLKESAVKCFAKSVAELSEFTFEGAQNHFEKYGKNFSAFELGDMYVSVCSDENFSNIITMEELV